MKGVRLSPQRLEEVRQLYVAGDLPAKEISRRYGKRANWVNQLAASHGWPLRTKSKPATEAGSKVRRPGSRKPLSEAEYRAQKAAREAEIAARERRLEQPVQTFVAAPIADEPDAPAIPLGQCGCGKGASHPGRCWFRRGMPGPSQGSGVYARVRALEAELAALRERLNAIDKLGMR